MGHGQLRARRQRLQAPQRFPGGPGAVFPTALPQQNPGEHVQVIANAQGVGYLAPVLQSGAQRCLTFLQPVQQCVFGRECFMQSSQDRPVSRVGVAQGPLVLRDRLAVGAYGRRPAGRFRGMPPDGDNVAGAFSVLGQASGVGLAGVLERREQPCVQLSLAMRSDPSSTAKRTSSWRNRRELASVARRPVFMQASSSAADPSRTDPSNPGQNGFR